MSKTVLLAFDSRLFFSDWQRYYETTPAIVRSVFYPDAPAVRFNDSACDCQTHPCPCWLARALVAVPDRAKEFIKNSITQIGRDAATFILYAQPYRRVVAAFCSHTNRRALL